MNITELIGCRVLISEKGRYNSSSIGEVKIMEVSPSGNWVKLMDIYGKKYWKPVTDVSLVEVLKDLKPEKPPA